MTGKPAWTARSSRARVASASAGVHSSGTLTSSVMTPPWGATPAPATGWPRSDAERSVTSMVGRSPQPYQDPQPAVPSPPYPARHATAAMTRPARGAGSPGRVQPADRGALGRAPERLEFVVPRLAEQPGQLVLQRAAGRGRGGHRHRRAQPALGDHDVPVRARHRGERAELRRVAVANGVAARARLLGHLEAEPVPAGQRGHDAPCRAGTSLPAEFGAQRPRRRGLTYPGQAHVHTKYPGRRPLDMRA